MDIWIETTIWGETGETLVCRSMCDAAALAHRNGWTGQVHGFHESEWGIARDLMLAGF